MTKAKNKNRSHMTPTNTKTLVVIPKVQNNGKFKTKEATNTVEKKEEVKEKDIKYDLVSEYKVGKLIVSLPTVKQIAFMASKFSTIEWSGMLVWNIVSGTLKDYENLVIKAEYVFPMNIGTSAYTEYTNEADLTLDLYDEYPDAIESKVGHFHHHNSMAAFFSGTDMDELHNNADKHIAYLSLIMNNRMEAVAKLAMVSNESRETTMKDFNDEDCVFTNNTKRLIVYILDIELEKEERIDPIAQKLNERIEKIKELEEAAKENKRKSYTITRWNGYGEEDYYNGSHSSIQTTVFDEVKTEGNDDKTAKYVYSCYFFVPQQVIDDLLCELLDTPSATFSVIRVLDNKTGAHPLDGDEASDKFSELLIKYSREMYIKDNDFMLDTMLYESSILEYKILQGIQDKIKSYPAGKTKERLNVLIDEMLQTQIVSQKAE